MKTITRAAFLPAIIIVIPLLCSFRWPVQNKIITATFGESRWDHFHNGIDLGGGEQAVYPVAEGELIYYEEEHLRVDGLPSGMGNFVVIQHDRGLRSVYAHLKEGSGDDRQILLSEQDLIGYTGDTGSSYGVHLHFSVIDREFDQVVNPLLLLPPVLDTSEPRITGLSVIRNNQQVRLEDGLSLESGPADLVVGVYDLCERVPYFCPAAPYQIDVYLNGREVVHLTFEALRIVEGEQILVQSEGKTFGSLFWDEWDFRVGTIDLPAGAVRLEIIAKDLAGNESSARVSLQVRG